MNNQSRRRRWQREAPLRSLDMRILLGVVGIGVVAFLVGYLLTAVVFFRSTNRSDVVAVPDLRGLALSDTRDRLREAGLELVVGDSLPNPEVGAGHVLTQSPLPGGEVAPGTAVRVIISTGRERRSIPDVTGLPRDQAVRVLAAAGFEVSVEELPHERPAGQVIEVEPAPGTVAVVSATVLVRVSSGPPLVEVPSVLGLSEAEAQAQLQAAGLQVEVEYDYFGLDDQPVVRAQNPLPGDSLPLGQPVRLRVVTRRPPEPGAQ